MKEKIARYAPYIRFFLIYSLSFLLVAKLLVYLLPFLLSLLIAVVMKPVYDFMKKRLSFQPSFSATVITLFLFSIALSVAGFILYLIIKELLRLFSENKELLLSYLRQFDFFETAYSLVTSPDTLSAVSDVAFGLFRSVPLVITFSVITFALSVYFLNRLTKLKALLLERFHGESREKLKRVLDNAYLTVRRFIRSYMILYVITFVEAVFVFFLTKTPYPLVYAFITALADLLPVLGPGTVYLPIAVWHILSGQYIEGITIAVFFLITVVIRQIIEPKIVSDTVKISPIIVLSGLYFSIVSMNFFVLFYIVILVLLLKILKASEVFDNASFIMHHS